MSDRKLKETVAQTREMLFLNRLNVGNWSEGSMITRNSCTCFAAPPYLLNSKPLLWDPIWLPQLQPHHCIQSLGKGEKGWRSAPPLKDISWKLYLLSLFGITGAPGKPPSRLGICLDWKCEYHQFRFFALVKKIVSLIVERACTQPVWPSTWASTHAPRSLRFNSLYAWVIGSVSSRVMQEAVDQSFSLIDVSVSFFSSLPLSEISL